MLRKSMDSFLYENGLRHERVESKMQSHKEDIVSILIKWASYSSENTFGSFISLRIWFIRILTMIETKLKHPGNIKKYQPLNLQEKGHLSMDGKTNWYP